MYLLTWFQKSNFNSEILYCYIRSLQQYCKVMKSLRFLLTVQEYSVAKKEIANGKGRKWIFKPHLKLNLVFISINP